MTVNIPASFTRTIGEVWGEQGLTWLETLPALLADIAERWSLRIEPPFPNLSYNYVAPGVREDGAPVILRLSVPDGEAIRAAEALRLDNGRGMAQLLEEDLSVVALLLERLLPGTTLWEEPDVDRADTVAAGVARRLWRPIPDDHSLLTIQVWARGFQRHRDAHGGTSGPLPERLVADAERLYLDLAASQPEQVLLHGDFHGGNILAAHREPWLAIDPKGVAGEPAYDVATLLRDRDTETLAAPDPARVIRRRMDHLIAELDLDRERLWGWTFSQAVLSAIWSAEDHGYGWEEQIALAEVLQGIR